MQVLVAFACCYVLLCAVGMNWCLDRIRVYLRDCLVLRMCSVCIPMVSVLRGLRFTCGVTVRHRPLALSLTLHPLPKPWRDAVCHVRFAWGAACYDELIPYMQAAGVVKSVCRV